MKSTRQRRPTILASATAIIVGGAVAPTATLPSAQAQSGHRLCFTRFLIHGPQGEPATDPAGPALFEAKEIQRNEECGPLHTANEDVAQQLTGNISDNRWGIREEDVNIAFDSMDLKTTCEDFGGASDKLAGLTPLNHATDGWISPDVCRNMDADRTWWFWKRRDAGGKLVLESMGPGTPT